MRNLLHVLAKHVATLGAKRSDKWPAVRKAHLVKEPFCQWCGGTKNLEVHHMHPFHLNPSLELDDSNLITLCECVGAECHLHHGHLDNWKGFNPTIASEPRAPCAFKCAVGYVAGANK